MRRRAVTKGALGLVFLALAATGCGGGRAPAAVCDLDLVSVNVPDGTYETSATILVEARVRNNGPDPCPLYTIRFYLSADSVISTADLLLGSFPVTVPLAPGAEADFSDTVSWSGVAAGDYYVGAIVSTNDPDSSNNSAVDATPITLTGASGTECDLDVLSLDIPSGTYDVTDSALVANDVYNYGPDDCTLYTVDFYFSENTVISAFDTLVGSYSRSGGLASGGTDSFDSLVSWTDVTPGVYYLGMIVTSPDDPDPTDNIGIDLMPITVEEAPPLCDLAALSLDVPDGVYNTTGSVSVDNQVYNYGPDACPGYSVDFYLSDNTVITTSDFLVGSYTRSSGLAAGGTDSLSSGVFWVGLPPGDYYLGMIVTYAGDPATPDNSIHDPVPVTLLSLDDAYEPNGTFLEAWDFTGGEGVWLSSYGGEEGIQADEDWYEIYVSPFFHHLEVDCTFTHSEGDIDIALYDASGSLVVPIAGNAFSETETDDEHIVCVVPEPGTYYIQVYYGDAGNSYDLWWDDFEPSDDYYEPNPSPVQPWYLGTYGFTYYVPSFILVPWEEDYFSVYQTAGYDIVATLEALPDDYDLYIYDEFGVLLGYSENGGTTSEYVDVTAPWDGYFYVLVAGYAGAYHATIPYHLTVWVE